MISLLKNKKREMTAEQSLNIIREHVEGAAKVDDGMFLCRFHKTDSVTLLIHKISDAHLVEIINQLMDRPGVQAIMVQKILTKMGKQ